MMRVIRMGSASSLLWAGPLAMTAWAALAFWRPDTTWHLGPFLVAYGWSLTASEFLGEWPSRAWLLTGTILAGFAPALLATLLLERLGRLRGPTFTGSGSVLSEALLLAAVGALSASTIILRQLEDFSPRQ